MRQVYGFLLIFLVKGNGGRGGSRTFFLLKAHIKFVMGNMLLFHFSNSAMCQRIDCILYRNAVAVVAVVVFFCLSF